MKYIKTYEKRKYVKKAKVDDYVIVSPEQTRFGYKIGQIIDHDIIYEKGRFIKVKWTSKTAYLVRFENEKSGIWYSDILPKYFKTKEEAEAHLILIKNVTKYNL